MEPENVNIPEPERAHLSIQGKEYEVSLYISILECDELTRINADDVVVCVNYIKKLICEHVEDNDQVDINLISEECCLEYVKLFLKANPEIELFFQNTDNTFSIFVRFIIALKAYSEKSLENLKQTLSCISKKIHEMYEGWLNDFDSVAESVHQIVDQVQSVYKDVINGLADHARIIVDAFSELYDPKLSEEDKEKLLNQYRLWGDYGWTSTDFLFEELLDISPLDISDANKKAKAILNKQGIQRLFEKIEEMETIKKSDLAEIRKCFYSRNYKSCVLISFALVDARLIRSQGRKAANRKHGNRGIKKLEDKIKANKKGIFILTLLVENLFSCLNKMFEEFTNFEGQPEIINRHYIMHGMLHRKIIQRDAIQTILLVYNLYYLTDLLDIGDKN
ncbi:MAG: hypothetical protein IKW90_02510 [Lachnospiraceae bacterium]|nr:hypothetical protein [Lachnospiraceae bacterium]MBR5177659.1 hypothetical protein [Lachnospiraceae bacterium]